MAGTRKQTTSLWSVIEKMQRRLEDEGLDRDVVDAAVARGIEALLYIAPPVHREALRAERRASRVSPPLWIRSRTPAKA
jgi:hypothetical protein